ncbi:MULTISPECIES: hypothetical protein [unclassified Ruegeria]|uniref:hypothetical protein n=1 Tax=unclassified Ruegeria TaxID=2625375 RepID=UPI001489C3FF|nr:MULTISPECIES: hypothetical protein [unclassified Ruegeria]
MMTSSFDFNRDTASFPKTVTIECPNCQTPARFVPAELEVRAKDSFGETLGKDVMVVKADQPKRNYSNWHREHTLAYIGLGGSDIHSTNALYPIGMYRHPLNSLLGTSICDNRHTSRKTKIRWPQDAYFQLNYSGRLLWFYNREHVAAMLELLGGKAPANHTWRYWFDRKLPTVFKTTRARRQLPAKLKRMLRA